jgi:hypothetical protein
MYCGVVKIKLDLIRIVDSAVLHQQIERKDGMTFMRMWRKPFLSIK